MITTFFRSALALAVIATPLSAQINVRHDHQRGRSTSRPTTTADGSIFRSSRVSTSRHDRIPRGQLPPRGMCRVWIDGVPPGQQPAVTDCATAQQQAAGRADARVIYGDERSFPGRGKGKFKTRERDDRAGSVFDRRSGDDDDEDEIDDDEREEREDRSERGGRAEHARGEHGKGSHGRGRHGDK